MGFIKGLGNLLSGKPVFEPADNSAKQANTPPPSQPTGPKYIPEVVIERIDYYENGNNCNLNVFIKNRSNIEIFVDRLSLIGQVKELDFTLRQGEMRKFTDVYKGQILKNDNYKYCEIDYRTIEGDNFRTQHSVDYESKGDGVYHIKNLRYIPPVRDMYGDN